MDDVNEINEQIRILQEKRSQLHNQDNFDKEESIKKLGWVKECAGLLEINSFGGSGLPVYTIKVASLNMKNVPHVLKHLTVMGSSNDVYENMTYTSSNFGSDYPQFQTNSEEMLIEFLSKVQFKELRYNEKDLRVLEKAREVAKKSE